ncbi:MOB kinase activator 2-like isoform X1 [Petromyzon marinus]|uniref:MOB kinase activator 2-like isoform X1 n=1 Tax=Petromyzon marinus TaxID=7757 RepID=UPI003F707049
MKHCPPTCCQDFFSCAMKMLYLLCLSTTAPYGSTKRGGAAYSQRRRGRKNEKKSAPEERRLYLEPDYVRACITESELRPLITLPPSIELNEWLATHVTTFFGHVNLQYSAISEFCTAETCPLMTACNVQYFWQDERGKKVKCTGPQYVDYVMSCIQTTITDESVFPTKYGRDFPNSFEAVVRKFFRLLYHVIAHIYWCHFRETVCLDLHGHLNSVFSHFVCFAREFNLLEPKEAAGLDDLVEALCNARIARNHGKER